jgi:uncharacterized protein (DUF2126 family)
MRYRGSSYAQLCALSGQEQAERDASPRNCCQVDDLSPLSSQKRTALAKANRDKKARRLARLFQSIEKVSTRPTCYLASILGQNTQGSRLSLQEMRRRGGIILTRDTKDSLFRLLGLSMRLSGCDPVKNFC